MAAFSAEIDLAIKILTLIAIVGSAAVVLIKVTYAVSRFELIGTQQADEIGSLKAEVAKIADLMVKVALQNQRLDQQADRVSQVEKRSDERLTSLERRWDEVRRGEGLITERRR